MGVTRLCWGLEQTAIPANAPVPFPPTLSTGESWANKTGVPQPLGATSTHNVFCPGHL